MKLQFYKHLHKCICIFSAFASEICKSSLPRYHSFGFEPFLKWRGRDSQEASIFSVDFCFCPFSPFTPLVLPAKGRRWYMRYSNRYLEYEVHKIYELYKVYEIYEMYEVEYEVIKVLQQVHEIFTFIITTVVTI